MFVLRNVRLIIYQQNFSKQWLALDINNSEPSFHERILFRYQTLFTQT
jgi:hypothetical protein